MLDFFGSVRQWLPVPIGNGSIQPVRWLLLEANRLAVTGMLLGVTFVSILTVGTVWPFEVQRLLTETEAVQTVLNTFMRGIIILVSIVVSINSIVLSYDITPVGTQEDRIEGTLEFRRQLSEITDADESPTDPTSFLRLMADAIRERAESLEDVLEGADQEFGRDVEGYIQSITESADSLEASLGSAGSADFGVLWVGLEADYGSFINRSRRLASNYGDASDEATERFNDLIQALEVFATGQEYFKTLYYSREISELSLALLVISLPAILVTAVTILAINANLFPDVQLLGFPPFLTFVAATVTIALAPYLVLTSYMLRVATVAHRTAGTGPFKLRS